MLRLRHFAVAALIALASPLAHAVPAFDNVRYLDLKDKPHAFAEWTGKVVVVNFWATWCAPCREEMPMLNLMSQKWGPRGVEVVGVAIENRAVNENKISVNNFVQQFSITYPILMGDTYTLDLMRRAGNKAGALPFTVVLDKNGRQVARLTGRLTEQQLMDAVRPYM